MTSWDDADRAIASAFNRPKAEQTNEADTFVNAWGRRLPRPVQTNTEPLAEVNREAQDLVETLATEYLRIDGNTAEHAAGRAKDIAKIHLNKVIAEAGSTDDYLDRLRAHANYLKGEKVRASRLLREPKASK